MICRNCGHENKEKANFCSRCGSRLFTYAEDISGSSSKKDTAESSESKAAATELPYGYKALIAALITACVLLTVFVIVLISILSKRNGNNVIDVSETEAVFTAVPTAEPSPTVTPVPTPSPLPPEWLKPGTRPTPTPSPIPFEWLKPGNRPTPTPTLTPAPTPTPLPETTPEPDVTEAMATGDDCSPVEALCRYMTVGGSDNLRAALPPEYLTHVVESYGYASSLLGGEDAVIEYAGRIVLARIRSKYGKISSIEYTLVSRKVLSENELAELISSLDEYGMTTMPSEAHHLTIDIYITSSKGSFSERLVPRVLYIDGNWYIDPEDIDF